MHDASADGISPAGDGNDLDREGVLQDAIGRAAIEERNRRHLQEYVAAHRAHRAQGPCRADEVCAGLPVARSLIRRVRTRPGRYVLTLITTAVRMLTEAYDEATAEAMRLEMELHEAHAMLDQAREELAAADLLIADLRPALRVVEP